MRIAIMGAGGIGGYYGGLLARGGHEIALVARGAHLQSLRAQGLRVESAHGDFGVPPATHLSPGQAWATDDPAEVGPVDLVLFTVKMYDLAEAGRAARPLVGPETVVLPLENGLDAADELGALLGAERILPGVTYISAVVAAPGVIRQTSSLRRIVLGEPDGRITPRAERVRDVLAASGVEAVLTADVRVTLWSKFVLMATGGGVCAATRLPLRAALSFPETRALYLQALGEAVAVGRAEGVNLPTDIVEQTVRTTEGFPVGSKPSLLVDLEAGRRLELKALSGAVVRRGQAAGVATPVHRVLYALLLPWAAGARTP